jgi:hypothetical protein
MARKPEAVVPLQMALLFGHVDCAATLTPFLKRRQFVLHLFQFLKLREGLIFNKCSKTATLMRCSVYRVCIPFGIQAPG